MSSLFGIGAGGETEFYPFEIDNSLRLNRGDSAHLERTPSSEGDRRTNTVSLWVKRSELGRTTRLFMATNNSSNARYTILEFNSTDTIRFYGGTEGTSALFNIQTNALFRDTSAWYHIVAVMDTTQSTSSDRFELYVNGIKQTTLMTTTYGSQNAQYAWNDDIVHYINKDGSSLGNNFSTYYVAEVNFIDGQALSADSFGQFKSGVWIPKDTSGLTFGTNGFRLQFGDSSAIGDDTSGNGNDFTSSALETNDVTLDSPTNNFATLNPLIRASTYGQQSDPSPTDGNLSIAMPGGTNNVAVSTFELVPPNKYRAQFTLTSRGSSTNFEFGIGSTNKEIGVASVRYNSSGKISVDGSTPQTGLTSANTVGDAVEVLVDLENDTVKFALKENGSSTWASLGVAQAISANVTNPIVWVREQGSSNINGTLDFGQLGYSGSDDSTYSPMSTANLPEPAITPLEDDIPEDYFEANLWTGNGSSQSISSYEFAPDWVWIKERSSTSSHYVVDTVRGASLFMQTNSTAGDTSNTVNVTSFDSNGFSLGNGGTTNQSSQTYVGWAWLAGTAFSNDASATGVGTIDSTGQVNTEAGFAIISHTGTGSAGTIAHGLGKKPAWIMTKLRSDSGDGWLIYHHGLNEGTTPEQKYIVMSSTSGMQDNSIIWNDTAPTTSVFSVGTSNAVNGNTETYISYVFAEISGYSKFGFYTGVGSTDGVYVYTGFKPALLIVKQTDASNRWIIFDNKRGSQNESDTTVINNNPLEEKLELNPSDDTDESTSGTDCFDFLSNGFKLRRSGDVYNGSGHDYIYMAFAEMPFKYANAR